MRTLLYALAVLCVVVSVSAVSYTGSKVVRAYIKSEEQLVSIQAWELDVWSRDSALVIGANDILVYEEHLLQLLALGVDFDVLIEDVEKHLEEGQRDLEDSRRVNAPLADFFLAYHTYDEIGVFLRNLSTTFPNIAKYGTLATASIQGRSLYSFTVTGTATGTKKKIFISGGQHAREWVAPATVLYIIERLVTLYGTDPTVKSILDQTQIFFVPLVNPDGYVYTWSGTANRLWRKNRRANTGGSYGVDLNRNWNDHWGGEGSSGTPTSDTYRGTGPFSEPESTAVSNFLNQNAPFGGAIDYHSYSQLILRPYGWSSTPPPNDALATTVGNTIRTRILAVNNVAYTSQHSWQLYYTTGSAQDWYYGQAKVPLSYTIELRDTGTYGFQLPAAQIKPTGAENWAGFVYFAQAVIANT